jgi:hypothetical protein
VTCIVGLVDSGKVWIGGDSASVEGYSLMLRSDPKVFRNGPYLFGFTTSFRMGQLLRYRLSVTPRHPDVPVDQFMATTFIDEVRACLKVGGFATLTNGVESAGCFLVGYEGRIFRVDDDYQVGAPLDPYAAVGCGQDIALGSLYATPDLPATVRVEMALTAAEHHSAGVRAPFTVLALSPVEEAS